jgi:hypothetical protein
MPRRLAAVASVVVGLGLIGASADGVLALDSQLEAATTPTLPARMTEDYRYDGRDGRCRPPELGPQRTPEV